MASLAEKRMDEAEDAPVGPEARPEALRLLEALLFASTEPLDTATLAKPLPDGVDVKAALAQLQAEYATHGVNLVRIGNKWTFRTAGDLAWLMTRESTETRRLSRAAIEVLSIIAYHQPVTRAEIEEIRGVVISRGTLDTLMEAGWILPRGRKQTVGRPATWVTTDAFLEHFGLAGLGDLPGMEELRAAGLVGPRPVATLRETIGGDRLPDLPRAEGEDEAPEDVVVEELDQETADRAVAEAEAAADRAAEEAEGEAEPAEAEHAESESDRS